MKAQSYINEIHCEVPDYEVHSHFITNLDKVFDSASIARKMRLLSKYCGVEKRYTVLDSPIQTEPGSRGFYSLDKNPGIGERMSVYEREALGLALKAVRKFSRDELNEVTHLVVGSCTGFFAPGLDLELIKTLELSVEVERTFVGFMGCHAAMNCLRVADSIVRSDPDSKVLVLNLELCSLHLQNHGCEQDLIPFLIFADGCSAALVSAQKSGLKIGEFKSRFLQKGWDKMSWKISDSGFLMRLDSSIPALLKDSLKQILESWKTVSSLDLKTYAMHPGGAAILDTIRDALEIGEEDLGWSRKVLREYGNMSSASVMFVMKEILNSAAQGNGIAMAFGPGVSMEAMQYEKL